MIFGQGVLTDELHNLSQLILSLEDLSDALSESHELWGLLLIELVQGSIVVGEGDVPVDGWEMLSLGELLIQTPENRHNGEGGRGNWISEISTWWGHCTDNRDGTFTAWGSEAPNTSSSLIELGEGSSQIGWETRIGGHLCETTRDLSQSLGPSGGGVSHHSHIGSLISEILSQSNSSVNGGLTSSDWHVRGIGDQAGTLHDIVLLSIDLSLKLGEVIKYLSHLVSTLTTSDIDDTVGVGVLGEGLRDTGLSASEGSWNGAGSSLHSWEEGVEDTLSSEEWSLGGELLSAWTWGTHRPEMGHGEVLLLSIDGLNDGHSVTDSVLALWGHLNETSIGLWCSHDLMLGKEIVLEDASELVTTGNEITWVESGWVEGVQLVLVEARQVDSTGDEDRV